MHEIWDVVKLLLFGFYILVRYPLALFVAADAGIRLALGWCGSRKAMAAAFLLALPVTVWNLAVHVPRSTATDILALALSALALAGLAVWAQALRRTSAQARHVAVEPLAIAGAVLFWAAMLIHAVMQRGFIVH